MAAENSARTACSGRRERQSHHSNWSVYLETERFAASAHALKATSSGSEILRSSVLLTERAGVLIETLALPIRLLLFGAGPEIEPITQLAANLGWMVERFGHPSELAEDFRPDTQTAALVMNHNFGRDLLALDRLLPLQLRYVGLLGPRKRHAEILAQLSEYRPFDFDSALGQFVRSGRTRHRQ